ncbi:unnamed protein product [Caenorhabditis brenneri]
MFFLPVIITSTTASKSLGTLGPKANQHKNQFWLGVLAGLATEMFIVLSASVMYLKYVMVKRLHLFAIQMERLKSEELTV